ncbi:hypothetical protein LSTR_LSTR016104 [Laodelphax striatellus]|uniref:Uncharacterized protein n=1 Tax=Laodelphax striatellus TaxID=195883 RepID=A0A482XJE9_LAOST|nr:hypothetical protein LSTR_LSTR003097 [Laodelphax striatellus]RZF46185.1 hypothetical protein LSTR_LSTR016104 [Laodelphax striatellus]
MRARVYLQCLTDSAQRVHNPENVSPRFQKQNSVQFPVAEHCEFSNTRTRRTYISHCCQLVAGVTQKFPVENQTMPVFFVENVAENCWKLLECLGFAWDYQAAIDWDEKMKNFTLIRFSFE